MRKVNANSHQMQNISNHVNNNVETSNVHLNPCPGIEIDPHNSTSVFSKADVVRRPRSMQNISNHVKNNVETSNVHLNPCPGIEIDPHNSTVFSKADLVRQPRSNPNQDWCPVSMSPNQARDSNNLSTIIQRNQQNRVLRIAKNKKLARRLFTLIAAFGCCVLPSILIAITVTVIKVIRSAGVVLDYDFMDIKGPFRVHLQKCNVFAIILNSLINPLIYAYTYPKFKAELKKMFRW